MIFIKLTKSNVDKFFFDTNVLLILFRLDIPARTNSPDMKRYKNYSRILTRFLANRIEIVINEIVISEFYYASLKFARDISNFSSIKQFRNSETGVQVIENIFSNIKTMLSQFKFLPLNTTGSTLLNMLSVDSLDFNDKLIMETCRRNNLVLVTDDADFKIAPVDVLSANRAMF